MSLWFVAGIDGVVSTAGGICHCLQAWWMLGGQSGQVPCTLYIGDVWDQGYAAILISITSIFMG